MSDVSNGNGNRSNHEMPMDLTARMSHAESRQSATDAQLTGLRTDVRTLIEKVDKQAERAVTENKTPWAVIIAACSLVLGITAVVGSLSLDPIKETLSKLEDKTSTTFDVFHDHLDREVAHVESKALLREKIDAVQFQMLSSEFKENREDIDFWKTRFENRTDAIGTDLATTRANLAALGTATKKHMEEAGHPWGVLREVEKLRAEVAAIKSNRWTAADGAAVREQADALRNRVDILDAESVRRNAEGPQ